MGSVVEPLKLGLVVVVGESDEPTVGQLELVQVGQVPTSEGRVDRLRRRPPGSARAQRPQPAGLSAPAADRCGLFRVTPRSRRIVGVSKGRVRFVAVASQRLLRSQNRRVLRGYLRRAGL